MVGAGVEVLGQRGRDDFRLAVRDERVDQAVAATAGQIGVVEPERSRFLV